MHDRELERIVSGLEGMHGHHHWHWNAETGPLEICAGAILVQHTAWTNAERALERLANAGLLDLERLAGIDADDLVAIIRPAGSQARKAATLVAFAREAHDMGGLPTLLAQPMPKLRRRLLAIRGIGPETADCIVLYAAHEPSFVIDAYTMRLFERLERGPGQTAGYAVWKEWFETRLPRDAALWGRIHALIVLHGKHLCRARAPRCEGCQFSEWCSVPARNRRAPDATLPP